MPIIDSVKLPDGTEYDIEDTASGYASQAYVQQQIATINKNTIGLGNVDNTSDANKPVSTAQQTALDAKADKTDLASIIETSPTASQAISVGTYFYLDGVLVKAKTAIASGATFTENTNYTVVTDGALNEVSNDKGSVSVTADGVKTYGALLRELSALIDYTKVSHNTKLVRISSNTVSVYTMITHTTTASEFTRVQVTSSGIISDTFLCMGNDSSFYRATGTTIVNRSAIVATNGEVIRLYY